MNLGKAILELREASGMTLQEMSDKTGRTTLYLEKVEQCVTPPAKSDIEAIADALDIPAALIHVIGVEPTDVKAGRERMYNTLFPSIKELALKIVKDREGDEITD